MRTSNFSDSDGASTPTTPSSVSVISLPSDDDFEIILMHSVSASPASTANTLPSVRSSFGSFSLSNQDEESDGESDGESSRAGSISNTRSVHEDGEGMSQNAPRPDGFSTDRTGSGLLKVGNTFPETQTDQETDADADNASVTTINTHVSSASRAISRPPSSIMSASDARESIDCFLSDPSFTSDKANKLRLWQSLCVELGLVALEKADEDEIEDEYDEDSVSSHTSSPRSLAGSNRTSSTGFLPRSPPTFVRSLSPSPETECTRGLLPPHPTGDYNDNNYDIEEVDDHTPTTSRSATPTTSRSYSFSRSATPTPSRSATPTQTLPSLPTTLKAASTLLHARAHVNISEYLAARADPARAQDDVVGKYADLLYPSASSLLRDLRTRHRFVKPMDAKREWLQPLLKDFGFRRRREA